MPNLSVLSLIVLSFILMSGCSSSISSRRTSTLSLGENKDQELVHIGTGPDIGFPADMAFYPLKIEDGKVVGVYYSWRECTKKFLFSCTKWEHKEVVFRFDNIEVMNWFKANDFGLKKRPAF